MNFHKIFYNYLISCAPGIIGSDLDDIFCNRNILFNEQKNLYGSSIFYFCASDWFFFIAWAIFVRGEVCSEKENMGETMKKEPSQWWWLDSQNTTNRSPWLQSTLSGMHCIINFLQFYFQLNSDNVEKDGYDLSGCYFSTSLSSLPFVLWI